MSLVSVVSINYNTRELLEQCLQSVFDQRVEGELEVIVVDNGSTDGSAALVRTQFPNVKLVESSQNLGFAAANNLAFGKCSGRYILLLNPDAVLLEGALEIMIQFMEEHPSVGAIGPKLLNSDGTMQPSCFRFPTIPMLLLDFFPIHHRLLDSSINGRYAESRYDQPFPIDHPLGACMMVRKEMLDQVGPFDESFFMYCEEVDWCMRMEKTGWKRYFVPQARVIHYGGQSARQVRDEMFLALHRSRLRFVDKHYGPFRRWAARAIIKSGALFEAGRAWWRARRGMIGDAELHGRLQVCRSILSL